MSKLKIPASPGENRPTTQTLLKGIIEHDQFDDWLPDTVYYQDQQRYEQDATTRIEKLWREEEVTKPSIELLNLPRVSGQTVAAIALPLSVRVCAHGIIAAMAPRINQNLHRDKVYGFEFRRNGMPLFSLPGEGLNKVFELAFQAARADENANVQILDVVAFSRNARIAQLNRVLQQSGAFPDEANFLLQLIETSDKGLPSVDDAFAFLYNFYLKPVDQALFDQQVNFFRHRDEYFVLNGKARSVLEKELAAIQLQSKMLKEFGRFADIEENAQEDLSKDEEREEVILGEYDEGKLIATYVCDGWLSEDKQCSGRYELDYIDFRNVQVTSVSELFSLPARSDPLDALRVLPFLRFIHYIRRPGVLLRPPFDTATGEFIAYRQKLDRGRTWLQEALSTAINHGANWQITWVVPLLSDLGPLKANEITLLLQILSTPSLEPVAKIQARLALARSSSIAPDSFWVDPNPGASNYQFRAALLGASYLARRGSIEPWKRIEQRATSDESTLKKLLQTYMEEGNR